MTISMKHKFQSAKADSADATIIRPSNWNDEHNITLAASRLMGRASSTDGAAQEITLGAGLAFSGTSIIVNGAAITGLNASNLASGTVPDAVLNAATYNMAALNLSNRLEIKGSAPYISLIDTTSAELSARLSVNSNNIYLQSSADDVTFTTVFQFELDTKRGYINGSQIHTFATILNIGTSAGSARSALQLGGLSLMDMSDLIYTGTSNSSALTISSIVYAFRSGTPARNATIRIGYGAQGNWDYSMDGGTTLGGTWRARGNVNDGVLAQRVA